MPSSSRKDELEALRRNGLVKHKSTRLSQEVSKHGFNLNDPRSEEERRKARSAAWRKSQLDAKMAIHAGGASAAAMHDLISLYKKNKEEQRVKKREAERNLREWKRSTVPRGSVSSTYVAAPSQPDEEEEEEEEDDALEVEMSAEAVDMLPEQVVCALKEKYGTEDAATALSKALREEDEAGEEGKGTLSELMDELPETPNETPAETPVASPTSLGEGEKEEDEEEGGAEEAIPEEGEELAEKEGPPESPSAAEEKKEPEEEDGEAVDVAEDEEEVASDEAVVVETEEEAALHKQEEEEKSKMATEEEGPASEEKAEEEGEKVVEKAVEKEPVAELAANAESVEDEPFLGEVVFEEAELAVEEGKEPAEEGAEEKEVEEEEPTEEGEASAVPVKEVEDKPAEPAEEKAEESGEPVKKEVTETKEPAEEEEEEAVVDKVEEVREELEQLSIGEEPKAEKEEDDPKAKLHEPEDLDLSSVDRVQQTKRFYDTHAQEYVDGEAPTPSSQREAFLSLLRQRRGAGAEEPAAIVDVGCGRGRDALHFSSLGHRVLGVDFSKEMLRRAKDAAPAAHYLSMDVRDLRNVLVEDSVDGVWAHLSLHHLPKGEVGEVLKGLRAAVRSHGLLYISLEIGKGEKEEESFDADLRYAPSAAADACDSRRSLRCGYTARETKELLAKTGWEVTESGVVGGARTVQAFASPSNWLAL